MYKDLMMIYPIILCGGSGERLWPLSRRSYPKQFLNLIGNGSLFQQAATRLGDKAQKPVVITGDDHRFIVRQQLREAHIDKADVLIEPNGKNTAPAILAAACHVAKDTPDALILVMPSDHYIPDHDRFTAMVTKAGEHLEAGQILCFGITPDRPETGYGYIKVSDQINAFMMPVAAFTEKPDAATAEQFLAAGGYLWNAGIFMMRASDLLTLAKSLQPMMHQHVTAAYTHAKEDLDFLRLDPAAWADVPAESFDYAFMEQAQNIGCIAFDGAWSDLGDWNTVTQEQETDASGNRLHGDVHQLDCDNTLLWAEKADQTLTGIGLSNIMAVAMGDAVLVADRRKAQDVKSMVAMLKSKDIPQATARERENRPWGWFETIAKGETFHAKILHVQPGGVLSLQSHKHRSEHWVVVSGVATVVRNEDEITLNANESIYIHAGDKHQLRNETAENLKIIEVQTGDYFGEDDIIRYSDLYRR